MSEKSPLFTENLAKIFRDTMEAEGIKLPKKRNKPKEDEPEVFVTDGEKTFKLGKKRPKLVWSKKKKKKGVK
jgi:hypothetical protein